MCLVWFSLCPSCLGLSVLPGLVCVFPSSNCRSYLSLFLLISFQFLTLFLLLPAPLWLECWYTWSCPRASLTYPRVFGFFFLLAVLIECFVSSLYSKSLIWFLASLTLLLFPWKLFFMSISLPFVSDWIFFMLLRSSLNFLSTVIAVFWTLHLINCLSPFHLALFL